MRILFLIVSFLLCTSAALSGDITLKNGDFLNGELLSIEGSIVKWNSTSFGVLGVDISKIESINHIATSSSLSINGVERYNCKASMEDGYVVPICDDEVGNTSAATDPQLATLATEITRRKSC